MSKCEDCKCNSCVNACMEVCNECNQKGPAPVKWCRDHSEQLTIFDFILGTNDIAEYVEVEKAEKFKWHKGSPVGVVKEICNIEIMEKNGDCFLMTFFPNSAYKFSSMNGNFADGYVNIDGIKAWRYHEPYDEVSE